MSERSFTKADCMDWLDSLDDESIDLFLLDPPYNVLTGNMKNKNGAAVFHSRYTAKVSPSESDYEKGIVTSRFEIAIPWEEQQKLNEYKEWCYKWYCKAHKKLADDSFMFIFWPMKYLNLAYQIFDVNRVIFWQQPNMVGAVSGDFNYDVTPILIIRKGNPRLNKKARLWDKSSILKFSKPQGNYVKDKLCHPCFIGGTKVFVNNTWKNIETVVVGDTTPYGEVEEVMTSTNNDLYKLTTETGVIYATGNHPILVYSEGVIKWKIIKKINTDDLVLQNMDIGEELHTQESLNTLLSGKVLTDLNQMDMTFIIKMGLKPIIELKISNLSSMDYTATITEIKQEVAEKGIKFVAVASENYQEPQNIFTPEEDIFKEPAKNVYCVMKQVIGIEKEPMNETENVTVYNLAIKNNNFYDVQGLGIVHNCQKRQCIT